MHNSIYNIILFLNKYIVDSVQLTASRQEVYEFGVKNGMDIKPWTYYPPESSLFDAPLCSRQGEVQIGSLDWQPTCFSKE